MEAPSPDHDERLPHHRTTIANVCIALGSNIDAENNMHACAALLREQWDDIRFSHVYKTAPQGFMEQEDFLNTVAIFVSNESPEEVQLALQNIEHILGKNPPHKDGPRTIDLDLLLYDDLVKDSSELCIPHPRMHTRRFVLEPLLELLPGDSVHPRSKKTWNSLYGDVMDQVCDLTTIQL